MASTKLHNVSQGECSINCILDLIERRKAFFEVVICWLFQACQVEASGKKICIVAKHLQRYKRNYQIPQFMRCQLTIFSKETLPL